MYILQKKHQFMNGRIRLTTNVFPDTPCVFVNHENNMF